jgi:hypothetical protein
MRKYAAATALVIAVNIAMLTPAVSAGGWGHCWTKMDGSGGSLCHCTQQCWGGSPYLATLKRCKPGAFCDRNVIPPDIHACLAKCRATQH